MCLIEKQFQKTWLKKHSACKNIAWNAAAQMLNAQNVIIPAKSGNGALLSPEPVSELTALKNKRHAIIQESFHKLLKTAKVDWGQSSFRFASAKQIGA
jgi:hypothetical protein